MRLKSVCFDIEKTAKVNDDNPPTVRRMLHVFTENLPAFKNIGFVTDYGSFILISVTLIRLAS